MMSIASVRGHSTVADLTYEVSFEGVASPTLQAAFVDCELLTGTRRTIVRCPHGALGTVMARIEEFGLELLDVRLVAGRPADHPDSPSAR
jgi:hypothetical protein